MDVDLTVLGLSLLVTLAIGLCAGRKTKTLSDYALGSRLTYSNSIIASSILASLIGWENSFGLASKVFESGVIFLLIFSGSIISKLLIAKFLAPRIEGLYGCLTIGDVMEKFYGKAGRLITGLSTVILCIGYVAITVVVVSNLAASVLGINHKIAGCVICGLVTVYTVYGGMRSVTATDVFQFVMLIIAVPLITLVALGQTSGIAELIQAIPDTHLQLIPQEVGVKEAAALFIVFCIPFLDPVMMQRLLATKDKNQITRSLLLASILELAFYLSITLISLAALSLNPTLQSSSVLPYVITTLLPIGFKGVAIAGIVAMLMASIDSYLTVGGIALVNDVITSLGRYQFISVRLSTLGISAIATSIAFLAMNLLSATASFLNFWLPTVGVLSIAAVLGIRTHLAVFVSTSASGFIAYLMWQVFELQSKLGVSSLFPSTIVSIGVFTCAHLVSNYIKKYQGQVLERINIFNHLANASQRHTDKFGIQYKLFGVIAALNYIVPVFVFPNQIYQDKLALVLYLVSGLLAILLVLKDGLWLQRKQYFSLYWHITLCICLPCLASYMLFASNGELYVNLILSTLFLALLVDWAVFTILFSIGTLTGYVLYAAVHPDVSISAILTNFDPYFAVYICVFGVVPTLVFINKRQNYSHNLQLDDEEDAQVQHIAICPPKVDATPRVSTTMHVSNSIPVFHNDLHLVDYKDNKEKPVHLNTDKVRVLVVDNDHMYLNILGLYLEDFGYQVEKITSGKSALDYLNTMNFDLILLNTTTSDMPGFEVLIQFKRNSSKQIPVIIQTKLEEGNMLDKFLQVGAAGYISKPYIKNNIKAVIDRVLHEPDMAEAA